MDTPKTGMTGSNGSAGNWDQSVDQAKSSAHSAIDKASENARPAVDKATAVAHDTVERMSDTASQTAAMLSDRMNQMMEMQEQLLEDTRVRVRDNPMAALAIAAGVGLVLGALLRSR